MSGHSYPFDIDAVLAQSLVLRAFVYGVVAHGQSPGSTDVQKVELHSDYHLDLEWSKCFVIDQLLYLSVRIRSMACRLAESKSDQDQLLGPFPKSAVLPSKRVPPILEWMQLFNKLVHAKNINFIEFRISGGTDPIDQANVITPQNLMGRVSIHGTQNEVEWNYLLSLEPIVENLPLVVKRLRAHLAQGKPATAEKA